MPEARARKSSTLFPFFGAAALAVALLGQTARAQYFGQNKVQYEKLDWSVLRTTHFEIYFHQGEKEAAVDAGRMAERAYERLSTILDHQVKDRILVVLYASQTEFQRTNITPDLIGEGTGGFTEFAKRRVTVPLTGSYRDFDHVLTHELVHAFQIDMMSGGGDHSLTAAMRYTPPLWFTEGMAEYLSLAEVDPQTEMWLRDGALEGYLTPLRVLDEVGDIRVYRYGQAILAYLGATYGDQTIGEVLRRVGLDHSLDHAFEHTVGLTLERFSHDWTDAMRKRYLPTIRDHQTPEEFAFRLTRGERDLSSMNLGPAVSSDGSQMVYFSDRSLYNDLYLASALTGKVERRLVKSERKSDFESLRFFTSSVDWAPSGDRVVFVALANGRDVLDVMRVQDRKVLQRIRPDLDAMLSPSFSPDGQWIVFSGMKGGRSNLYRVRADGTACEELTEGRYTAQEPRYSPDGKQIVFVTDRGPGTDFEDLVFSLPVIALFDLETREVTVLPGQAGRNISPQFFPDGRHLAFISDRSGIANLYLRDLDSGQDRRVSDILTGVSGVTPTSPALSLSRNGKRLVFSAFSEGTWDLYAIKDPLSLWETGTVWTPPSVVRRNAAADSLRRVAQEVRFDSLMTALASDTLVGARAGAGAGPLAPGAGPASGDPSALASGDPGAPGHAAARPRAEDADAARMDSLMGRVQRIGTPAADSAKVRRLFRSTRFRPDSLRHQVDVAEVFASNTKLPDPSGFEIDRYHPRFTADYASANGFFASNVGLAAQSVLQFSDILGDQVILVGADVYGSLSDSDLLFEYVNLKRRTNWGVSAFQFRNDFYIYAAEQNDEFHSQVYRGVDVTVQRPFNRFRRVEWSLQGLGVSDQVFRESFATPTDTVISAAKANYFYVSPGMALVTDNTIYGPTGPIGGGRSRLSIQAGVGDLSYRSYIVDLRRYLNLRHEYALAGRIIGATSEGRDPQFFRIGGPYTLRGYPFGQYRGTSIALAGLEFRFPLIDQLRLGFPLPIVLQGVRGALFFDAGAAWDHTTDFRAFEISGGRWRLRDVKASYGLSTSVNLGFTVLKWDLSWPTDLARNVGPARGYLSLGLDW